MSISRLPTVPSPLNPITRARPPQRLPVKSGKGPTTLGRWVECVEDIQVGMESSHRERRICWQSDRRNRTKSAVAIQFVAAIFGGGRTERQSRGRVREIRQTDRLVWAEVISYDFPSRNLDRSVDTPDPLVHQTTCDQMKGSGKPGSGLAFGRSVGCVARFFDREKYTQARRAAGVGSGYDEMGCRCRYMAAVEGLAVVLSTNRHL